MKKLSEIDKIELYPYGLWHKNTELHFDNTVLPISAKFSSSIDENMPLVKVIKLDDIAYDERITFIKMDIEGAELNALKGSEQIIKHFRPKLAISVYHKPEDLWEIPAYILSLRSDYKLYFRHYSFTNRETVLYAI